MQPRRLAGVQCSITKVASDSEGRPIIGETSQEPSTILKIPGEDLDVSAVLGSAPDQPVGPPRRDEAVLLLPTTTRADVNDLLEVAGMRLIVTAISPSYDSVGKASHHVVRAVTFANLLGE
jgi:hypothetical protein